MPVTPTSRDMLGRTQVVSLAEARACLLRALPESGLEGEEVDLEAALGRVTLAAIRSPEDLPAHNRSTMDGYAVRAADVYGASERLPAYLEISGEVRMGEQPSEGPRPGTCFRIATGGLLPPGTDAVVMLEHTIEVDGSLVEVVKPVAAGANVITAGEDVARGEVVLPAGHQLRAQDLGLLAGLGLDRVSVRRRVRVGILSTGDEVVPFRETPPPGKIRDTNGVTLAAMIRGLGGLPNYYGIAVDEEKELLALAGRVLAENDLLLISGSSSVGSRDLGERVLASLGEPGILVHGVAVKPGKPVIIALAGGKPMFGLPGHPVSALVAFELFVRPVLDHLAGSRPTGLPPHRTVSARLGRNLNSASGRRDFVRVQLRIPEEGGQVEALPVLGKSGALSTLVGAHGYVVIDENRQGIGEGETVEVQLFDQPWG